MAGKKWSRNELLLALDLYCKIPFGRFDKRTKEVIELGGLINRTPSSVAMKLCNFAALDPAQNGKGLRNASSGDREIWNEFFGNWDLLVDSIKEAKESFDIVIPEDEDFEYKVHEGPTEKYGKSKQRLVQRFFRNAVLSSYSYKCAFCRIEVGDILIASHIIPWSVDIIKRADPRNGLCLCSLHDKAFDKGLISVNDDFTICICDHLKSKTTNQLMHYGFQVLEGQKIALPEKFLVEKENIQFHRKNIYKGDRHE